MARKKNSKALFEVLSQGQGSMKVPAWAKKTAATPGHPLSTENERQVDEAEAVEAVVEPLEQQPADQTPAVTPPIQETPYEPEPAPVDDMAEEEKDLDIVEDVQEPEIEVETEAEPELEEQAKNDDKGIEEEADEELEDDIDDAEDEVEADVEDVDDTEEASEELEDEIEIESPLDEDEVKEDVEDQGLYVEEDDDEEIEDKTDNEELEDEIDDAEDEVEADVEDVDDTEEAQEELDDEVEMDVEEESEPEPVLDASVFIEEVHQQLAEEEIEPQRETPRQDQQRATKLRSWSMAALPLFNIAGDRIRLSVNFVTAGVIVLIVFTLLLAAYVIGKKTASPSSQDTSAAGVGQTIPSQDKPPLPGPETEFEKIADGPIEAATGQRDPKRYYLVIETLKGAKAEDYDDAEEIINFCAARGLPAEMVNIRGRFAVWCLLGFRSRISDAAIGHAQAVERVGEEYFAKKKTYRFMQRNKRGGELRPFFKRGAYRK